MTENELLSKKSEDGGSLTYFGYFGLSINTIIQKCITLTQRL